MRNPSRNHHFVAQVEQRLNSINPNISKKNQKIYSFEIIDRENYCLDLISESGEKIEDNLSFDDLFSFKILNERQRLNLEQNFARYERDIGELTKSLLKKIEENNNDIKKEILEIFALKLLNSFRNPYCIKKTLNTIGELIKYSPTNAELKELYEKIDTFNHPDWDELSITFDVSIENYRKWLKSLFMVLVPKNNHGSNILELIIKVWFEKSDSFINVYISQCSGISGAYTLVSDRGYTLVTDSEEHTAYEFNLSSTAYISYVFTNIKSYASELMNTEKIKQILTLNEKTPPKVKIHVIKDNPNALSRYNKNVIDQSFNKVFCKSKVIYGI